MLHRALEAAAACWGAGERRVSTLRRALAETLAAEPLARVDYAAVVDPASFRELEGGEPRSVRLCLAVFFGRTRLIDNRLLLS